MIHQSAVDILLSKSSQQRRYSKDRKISKADNKQILEMISKLAKHYRSITFTKGLDNPKPISPTHTLLSKIMLGTFGCVPAYDRYFMGGLKETNLEHASFNRYSLTELLNFIETNKTDILNAQLLIKQKTKNHYPLLKIIDMYFWLIGYDTKK